MNKNNKNYAQAAAAQSKPNNNNTYHQNQQHHHQQVSQQNQTSGTSTSSNYSSSANGKANNKSQTKPQAQHNSTMGNGNTGRSTSIKQKNPVQLPTNGHAWEKKTLEFGSINTPNAQISSSTTTGPTLTSGGGLPTTLPTKGGPTFGTLSNTTTQTTQTTQATPTTVGTSGPGVNNNNNNNSNSNSNNNNGVSLKPISTRAGDIPRTHSAPPQIQDNRNVGQPYLSNVPTTRTIHQQQSAVVSHQQPSASVSNPPLNHRKDSVSSTVSSNDGQPPFHPHHSPHHPNHTHNTHHHYGRHHNHKPNMGPPQNFRPRDKNVTHPSPHLNPAQSVSTQGGVPMAGPPQMWNIYNRDAYHMQFYPGYPVHPNPMFIPQQYAMQPPRPPQMQQPHTHLPQVPAVSFKPQNTATKQQSRAIEIIDPTKNAPIQYVKQHQSQLSKSPIKREEAPPAVFDKKPEESDKEKPSSEDKGISKAVPIVDPAERERKEEQERLAKEKEEQERKEREERERLEAERKEKEEKERREREEREKERIAKEKEEQERREREERERKEREERERKEREERERIAKEKEEQERKEREEQERIAKEKEEQERKEREKREREEKERLEKERLERERIEREERERIEREEQERLAKEKEEQERKEREEKERLEKERLEAVRIEKEKKEKEDKERREAEEKTRKEQEEKEKEEIERKKREEEEAKTKVAEDDEKKKEKEAESNDSKKEEKKYGKGHRPGPLDLSRTTSAPAIPSAPLSALGSARAIDDINSVQYPEGISSPNPALNSNAEPGKFKYDRSFLMQFMGVCKEKPENLPALEAIGMEEPKDDKRKTGRPSVSRSNTSLHKNPQFAMGEFKFPPKTSEERFAVSNMRNGPSPGIFGRTLGGRTGSGSTLLPTPGSMSASTPQSPSRTSSGRGATRKGGKGSHQVPMNIGEQVAPLERSENRWIPGQDPTIKTSEGLIPIGSIQRKVKALLNKLTLERFDSISDQIIEYANKSRDERDGRILREVIRLIFEKSCDESNFCAMYAQLCRKMMERVDPEIVDENVKNTEGKFVQGGTLFRKYLLNRCQEDFEKGWKVNIPVPSNEKGEPDLMSDEYYVAAKAKRQGLGLIRFIGELFKLNMLTERIMHECIKKLLIYQGSPEEEEMESLCKLMNTVGEQLDHVKTNQHEHIKANQIDHSKAKQLMDTYFNRMEEISKLPNLSSRIKFMIMDVIDLRSNSWKPRRDINAPKTIAEIHEDAAKQKEEAEFLRRSASSGGKLPKISEQMSRSGSGRRDHKGMAHGSSPGNDGWINVGGSSSQRKDKVGDLTKFGSVSRGKITGNNFSLAPGGLPLSGGAKGWKSDNKDRDDKTTVLSRTNSTSNMYSVLTAESSEGRKSSESSSSEIQKPSPPTERKKIILAPRTKNITTEESHVSDKPALRSNPDAVPSVQSMSNNELTKKINNMMEEYFSVLDIQEVIQCIKEIPSEHHAKAIESFANKVLEKKQKDVDNVTKLFKKIVSSETCDINTFKNGFGATLEFLMEIGEDAPMSYSFTGQLLFSAGLDFRDITKLLIPLEHDKSIEKIVKGYTSALKNDVDEQKYVQKINEFDFKSLFPKKNKDDINKYLEDLGLESSKK